jgi:hypothetical protein
MEWVAGFAIIALAALPPRYDPAIRLKYWLAGKKFPAKNE